MKFEIYDHEDGKVGYRLVGANGETMNHAEGFHSDGNARRAIKRVKEGVKDAPIVRIPKKAKPE